MILSLNQKQHYPGLILILSGALFKVLHWPMANVLIILGALYFPCLYLYRLLKASPKSLSDYLLFLISLSAASFLVIKLLHLPYQSIALAITLATFLAYVIALSFQKGEMDPSDTPDLPKTGYSLLYLIGSMVVIAGALFKILHWPYANLILISGLGAILISFFIPQGKRQ